MNTKMKDVNTADAIMNENIQVPYNADGSLAFYWYDAHEENFGADIYLFGKVFHKETNKFISCALKINGMQRTVHALPKVKGNKSRETLSE